MGPRLKSIRLKRIAITDNLSLIQSHDLQPDLGCMALIQMKKELVLIGLEPRFQWNEIFALLEPLGSYRRLSTIFLLEHHPFAHEMIEQLADFSILPNLYVPRQPGIVYEPEAVPSHLHYMDPGAPVVTLDDEYEFEWIASPFILSPEAMMIIEKKHRWLFSNRLFDLSPHASLSSSDSSTSVIEHMKRLIPSSLFLHPLIETCRSLPVDLVLTRQGIVYPSPIWQELLDLAGRTFFYNNTRTGKGSNDCLPYRECIQQVIQKLREVFGDSPTRDVLAHSSLPLSADQLGLSPTAMVSHASWHHLFETIYLQKGEKWLNLCEPMVRKIEAVECVEKPSIYASLLIEAKQTAEMLDDTNVDLKRQLSDLSDRFKQTEDRLTKDTLTGRYNELFLNEYLIGEIQKIRADEGVNDDLVLIGITIDNLMSINTKYTKEIGDETLINTSYLLEQLRPQEDMIFKRNGPGFFWLHRESTPQSGDRLSSEIQAEIAKSDWFIEPITVSLALVRLSEFATTLSIAESGTEFLKVAKSRCELLASKGPSALINQKTKIEKPQNGTILIVDDEPIQCKLLSAFFLKANYLVDVASDGVSALEKAKITTYDAIIAAKNLPKMDGLSLKNQLNENASTANVFFLLTTFKKTPDTILRANRFNVDIVMEKPLIFDELQGLISRHARRQGK